METKELIQLIKSEGLNNKIIIVDNCSDKTEQLDLVKLEGIYSNIKILQNINNSGYAGGNNFGIRYIIEKYNSDMILICNPDISFSKDHLQLLYNVLISNQQAGIAGLEMRDSKGIVLTSAWKLPNIIDEIILSNILFSKVFGNRTKYKKLKKGVHEVGVIQGAMFLAKSKVLKEVNFFDERTFLYGEERILATKLKRNSHKILFVNSGYFTHKVSTTINNYYSLVDKYKLLVSSKNIYFKEYRKFKCEYYLFKAISLVGLLEKRIIVFFFILKRNVFK